MSHFGEWVSLPESEYEALVEVARDETVKAVFDIAIHSMDFGSGFLDSEQVDHLRRMASRLGVDPRDATPEEHRRRYCTGHQWIVARQWGSDSVQWKCEICRTSQVTRSVAPDVRLGIPSK